MIAYKVAVRTYGARGTIKMEDSKAIYEVKFYSGSHCYKLQVINSREMRNGEHLSLEKHNNNLDRGDELQIINSRGNEQRRTLVA